MAINDMVWIIAALVILLAISHGNASYWKGKYESLDEERSSDGWENEVRFLRRLVNESAAEATE